MTKECPASWAQEYVILDGEPFSFDRHGYLREIYREHHPNTVIEKAAQMGGSIFAINKSLWAAENLGLDVIYFFPTDTDVRDFSTTRVRPLIMESEHLLSLIGKDQVDNVGVKQIGKAYLYFRGMKSKIRMKSVPADFIIFDELDEAIPKFKALASRRIDHSSYKWTLELSTPSIPDYGVDVEFQRSDQRYWQLRCPHCGEWNCLEDEFPGCLVWITKDEEAAVVCRKCRGRLDPSNGAWISKFPQNRLRRGYHLCQLYSEFIDLAEVLREWEQQKNLEDFYNSRLGIPWISAKNRLQINQVLACSRGYDMATTSKRATMGVDQGDKLHVEVSIPGEGAEEERKIILLSVLNDFGQLGDLMDRYDVRRCVIDAMPDLHSARNFKKAYPGRVFLCFYDDNAKEPRWDEDEGSVHVNRTESLDASHDLIEKQLVSLPAEKYDEVHEFAKHAYNLVKKQEMKEETGEIRWTYVRVGEDHFRHALNYDSIAWGAERSSAPLDDKTRALLQGVSMHA